MEIKLYTDIEVQYSWILKRIIFRVSWVKCKMIESERSWDLILLGAIFCYWIYFYFSRDSVGSTEYIFIQGKLEWFSPVTDSVDTSSFSFALLSHLSIPSKCYFSKAYVGVMADFVRALRSLNLTEDERNTMKCICLFTPGENLKINNFVFFFFLVNYFLVEPPPSLFSTLLGPYDKCDRKTEIHTEICSLIYVNAENKHNHSQKRLLSDIPGITQKVSSYHSYFFLNSRSWHFCVTSNIIKLGI